jgi:hypothetical protein
MPRVRRDRRFDPEGRLQPQYGDFVRQLPGQPRTGARGDGLSKGYLKSSPGITAIDDTGPGADRGAITWNGVCYRVMGSKLVSVVGETISVIGDVRDNGLPVTMDFSFDRLGIASNRQLYYWNADDGLQRVTDPDLGDVIDMLWIDGYWMTTDGTVLVVTDLNDPFSVNPLKYGSARKTRTRSWPAQGPRRGLRGQQQHHRELPERRRQRLSVPAQPRGLIPKGSRRDARQRLFHRDLRLRRLRPQRGAQRLPGG